MLGALQKKPSRRESLGGFRLNYKEAQPVIVRDRWFDGRCLPVGWRRQGVLAGKIVAARRQLSAPSWLKLALRCHLDESQHDLALPRAIQFHQHNPLPSA